MKFLLFLFHIYQYVKGNILCKYWIFQQQLHKIKLGEFRFFWGAAGFQVDIITNYMKNIDKLLFILVLFSQLILWPVHAADNDGFIGRDTGPGRLSPDLGLKLKAEEEVDIIGLNYGPGRVLPDFRLKVGYDDNLTLESSNEINTFFTVVSPHLAYVVADSTRKFIVDYLLEAGFYEGSSIDDFVDNRIRASIDYTPTRRIFAALNTEYIDSHDARGTGRAEGGQGITQRSLDEWHQWGIGGKFAYGAARAKGRIEAEAGFLSKEYDTNRIFTFTRDLDDTYGAARFFYRVRPKTFALIEARIEDTEYDRTAAGTAPLDSVTTRYLLGVTWAATYKTTGAIKVGYIDKDFDSDLRDDGTGLTWEIGIDWKPRTYSVVHFETAQTFDETNGTGDAIDTTHILLSWQHSWKKRFKTNVAFLYENSTFDPNREDDFFKFRAGADYAFRRWLNLGARYRYENLDSNNNTFDYDHNVFEITADFTL